MVRPRSGALLFAAVVAAPSLVFAQCLDCLTVYECDNGNTAGSRFQCGLCLSDGPSGSGSEGDCQACCNSWNAPGTPKNDACRLTGGCA